MMMGLVLLNRGRIEEALAEAMNEPEEWARLCALAVIENAAGRREEADGALRGLIEKYAQDAAYQIAAVHAFRGETDEAFAWLDRQFKPAR